MYADADFIPSLPGTYNGDTSSSFFYNAYLMLLAHNAWRTLEGVKRYTDALAILSGGDATCDWIAAGKEWVQRRLAKFNGDR